MNEPIDQFSGEHSFLSNFWPCRISFEDQEFPSTEHAFQAAKTLDPEQREKVAACDTPGKAKRLGKKVTLRPNWNIIRVGVMEQIVREKFRDPQLAEKLLATGERELVEGNNWNDRFWGVCKGKGDNWLGRILMKIRKELQAPRHGEKNEEDEEDPAE